ncbi:hypothetical protein T069G_01311 [Trichoderma breve]|uniref:Uncharacterized protein n=1 Tax=Trichoderma breve TaxID=2034170 RepID=A0A9W9JRR1_9HYPO|nr:hypothetical protein T069G_01311 [Trichoderma breve]KAJ4864781.1 hypothetical protein T069G_01311 [Trichoderma breve]
MSNSQWYSVYKLKFTLAVQDPDMPSPRYHTVIFVETDVDASGTKFHVIGDITSGMSYESTTFHIEDNSQPLHSKELLGYTKAVNFKQEWDSILKNLPPPPKQKAFNIETMKTEPVKEWDPLTFYNPGEHRKPLVKCTEWTEKQAIPALLKAGLIKEIPIIS